jgi:hypothetical protein
MELTRLTWKASERPQSTGDFADVQRIEKDILLLYHQLSEYTYIMGDLDWGDVFSLPYWEYLEPVFLEEHQARFIQDGCLMMILAMAWEKIDEAGAYIDTYIEPIEKAIETFVALDEEQWRLFNAVRLAVSEVKGKELIDASAKLQDESHWALHEIIGGYFISNAQQFEHAKLRADQYRQSVEAKKTTDESSEDSHMRAPD